MKEINIVCAGSSFDLNKLNELNGPIFLISFWGPIRKDENGKLIYTHIYNPNSQKFNKVDEIFKDTHNFVLLHYVNTTRDDSPYWKHIQNNIKITEDFIDYSTNIRSDWFDIKSKDCILIGMKYPVKSLLWRDVELNQYSKSQHNKILKELSYLNNRKEYYIEKTEKMPLVVDYLEKNIYNG